jgi:hypothetical protein
MKLNIHTILSSMFALVIMLCISCTEEYNFRANSYNNILAVQGEIASDYDHTEVRLSRSTSGFNEDEINESNALVYVTDNDNNIYTFIEIEPGLYKPENINFSGEISNEFFLTIVTSDGTEYISENVVFNDVPEIDSLYYVYHEIYSFEEENYIKGIDICIDTHWDKEVDYYLYWDYIETIQFWQKWEALGIEAPYGPCWQTKYANKVKIEETKTHTKNKLTQYEITHIDEYDYQPYYRCRMLVRQRTINKSVYDFWEMVRENNEDIGRVFDKIPYSPLGNIICTSDSDKKVFGYFNAGSVSTKYIYMKAPLFGINFADINDHCKALTTDVSSMFSLQNAYIISSIDKVIYTKKRECVDCAAYENSTRIEPNFWEYE